MVPGPEGPVEARTPSGEPVDLFELTDFLTEKYRRLYVVDLQGVERDLPQLDYLQEITRGADVWVDAGTPTADGVIDIIVAGASRAVVSTSHFPGASDLERAFRLTNDLVLEVEIAPTGVIAGAVNWGERVERVVEEARRVGVAEVIVSPRETPVDWSLVRHLAETGPVWVDGTFDLSQRERLAEFSATGGLFHVDKEIELLTHPPPSG
jgi:hypothetical protein